MNLDDRRGRVGEEVVDDELETEIDILMGGSTVVLYGFEYGILMIIMVLFLMGLMEILLDLGRYKMFLVRSGMNQVEKALFWGSHGIYLECCPPTRGLVVSWGAKHGTYRRLSALPCNRP